LSRLSGTSENIQVRFEDHFTPNHPVVVSGQCEELEKMEFVHWVNVESVDLDTLQTLAEEALTFTVVKFQDDSEQ
jgi:hypothetical protein